MQVFVPLSDDLLYQYPERIPADCRPYQCGMICVEWLDSENIQLDEKSYPPAWQEAHDHEK